MFNDVEVTLTFLQLYLANSAVNLTKIQTIFPETQKNYVEYNQKRDYIQHHFIYHIVE